MMCVLINIIIDVDECEEGLHKCNQKCRDFTGRYECSCNDGYQLTIDNYTCYGIVLVI